MEFRAHRCAIRASAAAATLLFCTVPSFASNNTVPDWVRNAAQLPLPSDLPHSAKAVVLLSETTYTVGADGRAVEHVREAVKILRPQGRMDAIPHVSYDKDSKILSFKVWSIDPGGHEIAAKDSDFQDYSPPGDGALYEDIKYRLIQPAGADPGGVIAYEYEKRERPYIHEAHWFFQDDVPRLRQSFKLEMPAGYTYATTWSNHIPIDGADTESHSYRWEMNNESAIDLEDVKMAPAGMSLAAHMTVHYAAPGASVADASSWKGVGDWYDALAHDRTTADDAIRAKAAELVAGKTDFFEKAEAIAVFMQDHIRYFVVEMGIGGYQPHYAADIFKNGYGDCKDKATLLSALLSAVGIHSTLVLVDTERGFVNPSNPSILGNHAIAAIEVPAGYESPRLHSVVTLKSGKRYLIFDPTWIMTPFGQLENNLQGSYGLITEPGASELVRFPVMPPELNTIRRSGTLKLAADGTLSGDLTESRFGDLAVKRRSVARMADGKEQQKMLDNVASHDFPSATLTGLHFANAETLSKNVEMSFNLQAAGYATSTGPLLMIRPRVFGTDQMPVDTQSRKLPIDLRETEQTHDDFDIEVPDGYVVDEIPAPVHADWGFAAYDSKTEMKGNKLHYSRTFTVREVTLPAEKYRDLQAMEGVIGNDEDNRVVLKRAARSSALAAPGATLTATAH